MGTSSKCKSLTKNIQQKGKQLLIDFIYIDIDICTRCKGTETNLNEAIHELDNLLLTMGYDVQVNRILVANKAQAESLQLISSPTIRVNGYDIPLTTKESTCESCSSITKSNVNCRVWIYQGEEYTEAPKGLIIDWLLQVVSETKSLSPKIKAGNYQLPENLNRFFNEMNKENDETDKKNCCSEEACC